MMAGVILTVVGITGLGRFIRYVPNVVAPPFGGIVATGTIARAPTNIRAGARSPVSGMLHAVLLLLFMLVAAPLLGYIPLAMLAGLLTGVVLAFVLSPREFLRGPRHHHQP